MTELFAVWTWQAFTASVVVGLVLGFLMPRAIRRATRPLFAELLGSALADKVFPQLMRLTAALTLLLGELAGVGFWVGQAGAEYIAGGESNLWLRVFARAVLFAVYMAALALGVGLWARRNGERQP